jgi:hypothetical protein
MCYLATVDGLGTACWTWFSAGRPGQRLAPRNAEPDFIAAFARTLATSALNPDRPGARPVLLLTQTPQRTSQRHAKKTNGRLASPCYRKAHNSIDILAGARTRKGHGDSGLRWQAQRDTAFDWGPTFQSGGRFASRRSPKDFGCGPVVSERLAGPDETADLQKSR